MRVAVLEQEVQDKDQVGVGNPVVMFCNLIRWVGGNHIHVGMFRRIRCVCGGGGEPWNYIVVVCVQYSL